MGLHPNKDGWYEITVAGDHRGLFFQPGVSRCGDVEDGVMFKHEGEGVWVIPMGELLAITRLAAEQRHHKRK